MGLEINVFLPQVRMEAYRRQEQTMKIDCFLPQYNMDEENILTSKCIAHFDIKTVNLHTYSDNRARRQ